MQNKVHSHQNSAQIAQIDKALEHFYAPRYFKYIIMVF